MHKQVQLITALSINHLQLFKKAEEWPREKASYLKEGSLLSPHLIHAVIGEIKLVKRGRQVARLTHQVLLQGGRRQLV